MDDRAIRDECRCRGRCQPRDIDRAAQARRLGLGPLAPQPLTNVRDEPTPLSGAASGGRDPQGGH